MKDTGCAAAWCRNSSSKGFKMNYFPRKEERRNAWIKNVNRANWSPTRCSALCEVCICTSIASNISDIKC